MSYTSADDPIIGIFRRLPEHTTLSLGEFENAARAVEQCDVKRATMISTAKSYRRAGDLVLKVSNVNTYVPDGVSSAELRAHIITGEEVLANEAKEIKARGDTNWRGLPNLIKSDEYRFWGYWGFNENNNRKSTFSVKGAQGRSARTREGYGERFLRDEPETHNTYREIMAEDRSKLCSLITGPAIALRRDYCIICIDLDPPERNIPENILPHKRDAYLIGARKAIGTIMKWAQGSDDGDPACFIETSRSGVGTHIFFRCVVPPELHDKYELGDFRGVKTVAGVDEQITTNGKPPKNGGFGHILLADSHVFLTGRKTPESGDDIPEIPFEDFKRLLDNSIAAGVAVPVSDKTEYHARASGEGEHTTRCGRQLGLTHAQVFQRMRAAARERYNSHYTVGDHSKMSFFLATDIDKVTGDPDQLLDMMLRSIFMQSADVDKNRMDRSRKFERLFFKNYLRKIRLSNDNWFLRQADDKVMDDQLTFCFERWGRPVATATGERILPRAPMIFYPVTAAIRIAYLRHYIVARIATDAGHAKQELLALLQSVALTVEQDRVVAIQPASMGWAVAWVNKHLADNELFFELVYTTHPELRGNFAEHPTKETL